MENEENYIQENASQCGECTKTELYFWLEYQLNCLKKFSKQPEKCFFLTKKTLINFEIDNDLKRSFCLKCFIHKFNHEKRIKHYLNDTWRHENLFKNVKYSKN